MHTILVTGSNGQLGQSLRQRSGMLPYLFYFTDAGDLDITDARQVNDLFDRARIDACINCAAYTAVDRAESEQAAAFLLNAEAPEALAKACEQHGTLFFHISTDFVFDGQQGIPYRETDPTGALNVYGDSKRAGEERVLAACRTALVVRTSWLYSEFGNNFVKTMLRLADSRSELRVVADQIGSPTYAGDLADSLLKMVDRLIELPAEVVHAQYAGIYHYSNEGVASWYDFAHAALELAEKGATVYPIPAAEYPTPAQRPHFSVMSKQKIKQTFGLQIPHWRNSLKAMMAIRS